MLYVVTAQTAGTYSTSPSHCWGESYQYDNQTTGGAWGNLTAIGVSNTVYNGCTQEGFSQTVLANNQISGFSYDAAGNWTGPAGAGYAYDAENHLVAADGVAYTYDGDGERIEKSSGEMYWYTSGGEVLDETDLSGNLTSEYIFFGGARIARRDGSGNLFYYLADHLGSSREIIEAAQTTPCYDADFYPFGGERAYVNNCPQNYKFTGKERDPESGLDDFSARFYGSWTGRFTSPDDPFVGWNLADPQSLNLYAYVQDNPINDVDPTGHCDIRDGESLIGCTFDSEESAIGANIPIEGVSTPTHALFKAAPDPEGIAANTKVTSAANSHATQPSSPQGTLTPQTQGQPATSGGGIWQGIKGVVKIGVGVGLIATVATGDVPGGAAGALLVSSAVVGGATTTVSGVTDVAGAATHTDVREAQQALDATSNLPGLVTTAATGGNLNAGKAAATVSDVATLAANPREATRNVATAVDAGRTAVSAGQLIRKSWHSIANAASNELNNFFHPFGNPVW